MALCKWDWLVETEGYKNAATYHRNPYTTRLTTRKGNLDDVNRSCDI